MAIKLLLADDSVTIHKVVGLTFAAEDVQVETVLDGAKALEKLRAERPDILLADVFMPGMSGYELCAAVKADADLALTPVVLLVGSFEPFDEEEATRVQCDAYLTKPFDTTELIKIVHHLVKQHREARSSAGGLAPQSEPLVSAAAGELDRNAVTSGRIVTERTRESFLGSHRILELFDKSPLDPMPIEKPAVLSPAPQVIQFPKERSGAAKEAGPANLSEATIDLIVDKVVARMSDKVVREIAWEVVPEVSEIMIRHYINQLRPKKA